MPGADSWPYVFCFFFPFINLISIETKKKKESKQLITNRGNLTSMNVILVWAKFMWHKSGSRTMASKLVKACWLILKYFYF
jgi:hypothetical protein